MPRESYSTGSASPEPRKRRVVIARDRNILDKRAREIADERLSTDYEASNFVGKFWRHNLLRTYHRQLEESRAREEILAAGSLEGGEDIDRERDRATRDAVVARFYDERVRLHGERGVDPDRSLEHREIYRDGGGNVARNESGRNLDPGFTGEIKRVIRSYALREAGFNTEAEMETQLRAVLRARLEREGESIGVDDRRISIEYATNILEIGNEVRQAVEAATDEEQRRAALTAEYEFVEGKAAMGLRTESERSAYDAVSAFVRTTTERIPGIGRLVGGFFAGSSTEYGLAGFGAAFWSVGQFVATNSATRTISGWLSMGAGAGAIATLRRSQKFKQDFAQHVRDRASGRVGEAGDAARVELDRFVAEMRSANDFSTALTDSLYEKGPDGASRLREGLKMEDVQRALATLADLEARNELSDEAHILGRNLDFISFSDRTHVEEERMRLDMLAAQVRVDLANLWQTPPETITPENVLGCDIRAGDTVHISGGELIRIMESSPITDAASNEERERLVARSIKELHNNRGFSIDDVDDLETWYQDKAREAIAAHRNLPGRRAAVGTSEHFGSADSSLEGYLKELSYLRRLELREGDTGVDARLKDFDSYRRRESLRYGGKAALASVIFGMGFQELVATFSDSAYGVVDAARSALGLGPHSDAGSKNTMLMNATQNVGDKVAAFFGWASGLPGDTYEFEFVHQDNATDGVYHSGRVELPRGMVMVPGSVDGERDIFLHGKPYISGVTFDAIGNLTEEGRELMQDNGITVESGAVVQYLNNDFGNNSEEMVRVEDERGALSSDNIREIKERLIQESVLETTDAVPTKNAEIVAKVRQFGDDVKLAASALREAKGDEVALRVGDISDTRLLSPEGGAPGSLLRNLRQELTEARGLLEDVSDRDAVLEQKLTKLEALLKSAEHTKDIISKMAHTTDSEAGRLAGQLNTYGIQLKNLAASMQSTGITFDSSAQLPDSAAQVGASGGSMAPTTDRAFIDSLRGDKGLASDSHLVRNYRAGWYDHGTPKVYEDSEQKLWWGGNNDTGLDKEGNYVMSIRGMPGPDGVYDGDGNTCDWREEAKVGNMKLLLSMSEGTQKYTFAYDINENGQAIVPKDDVAGKLLFANKGGHATFNGRFAEVAHVLGEKPGETGIDGYVTKILATDEGKGLSNFNSPLARPEEGGGTTPGGGDPEGGEKVTAITRITTRLGIPTEARDWVVPPIAPWPVAWDSLRPAQKQGAKEKYKTPDFGSYYYGGGNPDRWRAARSPRLSAHPDATLAQQKEAEWYFSNVGRDMGAGYLTEIESFVEKNQFLRELTPETKIIVCMPVAAAQEMDNIYNTLQLYAQQDADALEKTVILVNLNWPEDADQVKVRQTIAELERAKKDFPNLRLATLEKEWKRDWIASKKGAIYGTVVKYLNDTALRAIELSGRSEDVYMLTNDADARGMARDYLPQMLRLAEEEPQKDGFLGKIEWGSEVYQDYPGFHVSMRFLQYMEMVFHHGLPHVTSWGPNFLCKASAYAAVGGYDHEMGAGADSDLGRKIAAARLGGKTSISARDYPLGYTGAAWIDSHPGRLFESYTNGIAVPDTWNSFNSEGYKPRGAIVPGGKESLDTDWDKIVERIEFHISALTDKWIGYDKSRIYTKVLNLLLPPTDGEVRWVITESSGKKHVSITDSGKSWLKEQLKRFRDSERRDILYSKRGGISVDSNRGARQPMNEAQKSLRIILESDPVSEASMVGKSKGEINATIGRVLRDLYARKPDDPLFSLLSKGKVARLLSARHQLSDADLTYIGQFATERMVVANRRTPAKKTNSSNKTTSPTPPPTPPAPPTPAPPTPPAPITPPAPTSTTSPVAPSSPAHAPTPPGSGGSVSKEDALRKLIKDVAPPIPKGKTNNINAANVAAGRALYRLFKDKPDDPVFELLFGAPTGPATQKILATKVRQNASLGRKAAIELGAYAYQVAQ